MAVKDVAPRLQHFVEEIDYNEIEKIEVVGKGSFGVVWRGRWRDRNVAVKHIDSEAERKAFIVEVRQLSRVNHPNIVKLYGACTQNPVCLVMEFAEGGSLYNVLHGHPRLRYTAGHAMSWALQCARGVAYLHGMTPKALIHRDLKPPNLLLILGGKVLKICDFGTACDKQTYMTNNKGSAAWMAPEVFESSNYTEKCDVFSWGIILWEVIAREKPFNEVGNSAYRIMWKVHLGERPALIEGVPAPIEQLMTRCWDKLPANRPSMEEVVRIMSHLNQFFVGGDDTIDYSSTSEESSMESEHIDDTYSGETFETDPHTVFGDLTTQKSVTAESVNGAFPSQSDQSQIQNPEISSPLQIQVDENCWDLDRPDDEMHSLTQSINSSRQPENISLGQPTLVPIISIQQPNPLPQNVPSLQPHGFLPLHNRQNIIPPVLRDSSNISLNYQPIKRHSTDLNSVLKPNDDSALLVSNKPSYLGHRRAASHGNLPPCDPNPIQYGRAYKSSSSEATQELLENAYLMLDPQLHPLSPLTTCDESVRIFEEHKRMAQEYLKVQTELALLSSQRDKLSEELSEEESRAQLDQQDSEQNESELRKLINEKESLVKLHHNLKVQLELMRTSQNPSQSNRGNVSNNDGWVVVPRHDL